jgi:hypothetical protein
MKQIKLNLGQMSLIYAEIFGNQNTGTKGLATCELKINLKFKLHTLAKNLEQHVQFFQEENKRLVGLHGTSDESGNTSIVAESEGFTKFMEEMNAVAMIEHEVKVPEMTIEEFSEIQTTDYPAYLFNLIEEINK